MNAFVIATNRLFFKDLMPWLQNIMPDFLFKRLIKYHEVQSMKETFLSYFYVSFDLPYCGVAWKLKDYFLLVSVTLKTILKL